MFHRMPSDILFSKYDMFSLIENQKRHVQKAAEELDEHRLRSTALDELAEEIASTLTLDVPTLIESEITVSHPQEVEIPLDRHQQFEYGFTTHSAKGTSVTFRVPFTGDAEMFLVRPSTFTLNPPRAEVVSSTLKITFSGITLEQAALKSQFEQALKSIKDHLTAQLHDVATFNAGLKQLAYGYLNARKERLRKGDDLVGGLGYKVQ